MYKLNRRGTISQWGATQNDIGGPVSSLVDSWEKWMQVDDRDGRSILQSNQQVWAYDYKVIMRFEPTRPTLSNMTIDYGGQRLKINSVQIKTEGHKKWEVCRCSVVDVLVTQS